MQRHAAAAVALLFRLADRVSQRIEVPQKCRLRVVLGHRYKADDIGGAAGDQSQIVASVLNGVTQRQDHVAGGIESDGGDETRLGCRNGCFDPGILLEGAIFVQPDRPNLRPVSHGIVQPLFMDGHAINAALRLGCLPGRGARRIKINCGYVEAGTVIWNGRPFSRRATSNAVIELA